MPRDTVKRKPPSEAQLADLFRVPEGTLRSMRQRGCDILDARSVFRMLMKTTRKPDEWKDFFAEDEDSHEYWKRKKTKEEVEALRLKNAKANAEMFDRSDGDRIMQQMAAAFTLALSQRRGTAPQILAGKDEAWISDWSEEEDHKLLKELCDLGSALWTEVFESYVSSDAGNSGGSPKPAAKKNGK